MKQNLKEYGKLIRTVLTVNDTNQEFVIANDSGKTKCSLYYIYDAGDGLRKQIVLDNFSFEDTVIDFDGTFFTISLLVQPDDTPAVITWKK